MRYYVPLEGFDGSIEANFDQLNEIDRQAKGYRTILGRYLDIPWSNGRAYYQVTSVDDDTVEITACKGLGDDLEVSYYGKKTRIDRRFAETVIQMRDFSF